jgi:5-methylcytosine-specific restriction endonuclease McrA
MNKALEEYYNNNRHKDGKRSECKSCRNARQKEYNKSEKGKLIRAEYIKSDKGKATIARYNKSDKGKLADVEYRKTDKGKAAQAQYRKSEKGRAAIARGHHNSRYWKSKTLNTLDEKEFNYIILLQNNKCACCGETFTDELKPARDHIYPASKGGDFIKENIQALCRSCNSSKHTNQIDYRTQNHKEIITTI